MANRHPIVYNEKAIGERLFKIISDCEPLDMKMLMERLDKWKMQCDLRSYMSEFTWSDKSVMLVSWKDHRKHSGSRNVCMTCFRPADCDCIYNACLN